MTLNLEVGHFYVGRDGIVQPIMSFDPDALLSFSYLSRTGRIYRQNGDEGSTAHHDLLFECSPDGWVKWDGKGDCPIPWAKAGEWEFIFRDDERVVANRPTEAFDWNHTGSAADIIAFRLLPKVEKVEAHHKPIKWEQPHHPAWESFARWSAWACSPGNGDGHQVQWYWEIYRQGWDESANRCVREIDEAIEGIRHNR